MIHCAYQKGTNQVKVNFSLPLDGFDVDLAVVGDFNGWDPHATPMRTRGAPKRSIEALAQTTIDRVPFPNRRHREPSESPRHRGEPGAQAWMGSSRERCAVITGSFGSSFGRKQPALSNPSTCVLVASS